MLASLYGQRPNTYHCDEEQIIYPDQDEDMDGYEDEEIDGDEDEDMDDDLRSREHAFHHTLHRAHQNLPLLRSAQHGAKDEEEDEDDD